MSRDYSIFKGDKKLKTVKGNCKTRFISYCDRVELQVHFGAKHYRRGMWVNLTNNAIVMSMDTETN